ncbi:hypothetical protein [Enterobacter hormaechei]|uniref:hypothetical protein n=1 Tax=Enterobacter hormaechei TaxID=158836 RepID=UPI002021CDC1|nr:hypothetical protein [Enterobacter hormaechei]
MTAALTGLFVSNNPYAGESYLVYNPHNIAVFEVRFFNVGDGPFMPDWRLRLSQPGILASNKKKKYSMLCVTGLRLLPPAQGNCLPLSMWGRLTTRMPQVPAIQLPTAL